MSNTVIEARGLTKRYGRVTAVDALDLKVEKGQVFGLLGPNGAGKTTTILMLLGLTERGAGAVRVLGLDPARSPLAVKRRVGYLPDTVGFYDHLSGQANLRYTGRLAGLSGRELDERIGAAIARVGLADVAQHRVGTYSRGMRQRLGLAEILMKAPEVAILDEPTAGLDPEATHEFLAMIRKLKTEGITVLLSSHLLERVQTVCDRVALFHEGRVVLEGTVPELGRRVLGTAYRILIEAEGEGIAALLERLEDVVRVEVEAGGKYRLEARSDIRPRIAERLVAERAGLRAMSLFEPSLDEIYRAYFEGARRAA